MSSVPVGFLGPSRSLLLPVGYRGPAPRARAGATGTPAPGTHLQLRLRLPVTMEVALKAIAHPTRRAILRLVWDAERTAGELADRTGMSGPATSQHLKVLRDADLVTVRADATRRYYRANHVRLQELRALLEDFWGERLAQLQQTAESFHDDPSPG